MKAISSAFQSELENNVVRLALVVTLTRTDGVQVHMTNHDAPLTVGGTLYRNDLSFTVSAIRSDSTLASDNVTIDLGLDGEVFVRDEFRTGRWKKCSIDIAHVNFADPSMGRITMRRGLSRQVELRGNETARIEADGLLKVLDFTVGRTYTPGCTAEFGDKKCKVAVDLSQHRSWLNTYGIGDWVYWYDDDELTAETVTNGLFDVDGDRSVAQAITGWTKSTGATFIVDEAATALVTHYDGLRVLAGTTSTATAPEEQFIYQDVTLAADTADIDDGQIFYLLRVETALSVGFGDYGKLRMDFLDTNGAVLTSDDTGWYTLDEFEAWREKALAMPVPVGARTVRIYLMTKRVQGAIANVNFARVRASWWNITTDDPTHGLIFKAGNVSFGGGNVAPTTWYFPNNPGFEVNPARALSGTGTQNITGWTKVAGQFKTATQYGIGAPLARGLGLFSDDAHPNSIIYCRIALADTPGAYDPSDLAAGNLRVWLRAYYISWHDNDHIVRIRQYAADGTTLLATTTHTATNPFSPSTQSLNVSRTANLDPDCAFIEFEWEFIGDGSTNRMGLDDVQYYFPTVAPRRTETGDKSSPLSSGLEATEPTYTTDTITTDGDIGWVSRTAHVGFDEVSAVTDRKDFNATAITGAAGDYTSTKIVWLSGENAGVENIIRIFDNGTKRIKMYFPNPADIQIGDRFMYVQGCQKRFSEDCKVRFDNAVNFRGFPYVPGNVGQ